MKFLALTGPRFILLAALSGCSMHVTVTAHPDAVVCAIIGISSAGNADSAVVEYGATTSYGKETTSTKLTRGNATIPVFGLDPSATSHFRVNASSGGKLVSQSGDLSLTTGPLPANFPTQTVTIPNAQSTGYILMGAVTESDDSGPTTSFAYIVDRTGRPMWYRRAELTLQGLGIVPLSNGHIAIWNIAPGPFQNGGYEEIDFLGNVVHQWLDPGAMDGVDGHEMLLLPNGDGLLIGLQSRMANISAFYPTDVTPALMVDFRIDEITPARATAFDWVTSPSLQIAQSTQDGNYTLPQGVAHDFFHPDSLALDLDGNFVVSFRQMDTVLKLDIGTGNVDWQFGGKFNQFTISNDPLGMFNHQHCVRVLPNGHLLMVDDGDLHAPPVSRVVEYQLDEPSLTATMVWAQPIPPQTDGGSVQRLDNGDTFVGLNDEVYEIDSSGFRVWDMTLNFGIYRATFIPSL